MTQILSGIEVAAGLRAETAEGVAAHVAAGHRPPCLAAVLVGEDPASTFYVGSKTKGCAEVGMESRTIRRPASLGEGEILALVDELNADPGVDGILVQLPLPTGISERRVLERIDPTKDVDGFHPVNVGRLWSGQEAFVPATPLGVMRLLKHYGIDVAGRNAVVVGRSNIVGKPMAALLLAANATVTVCHSRTRDLPAVCRAADVLVVAIGRTAFVGAEHVKPGAVVIDVGINRVNDAAEVERLFPGDAKRAADFAKRGYVIAGDVDFVRTAELAGAITPVPGGVGLLTVASVIANTLEAARRRVRQG